MTCSTSIVNGFWNIGIIADNLLQWQGTDHKTSNRCGSKELAFVLLYALVEETLKQVSEELVLLFSFQAYVLKHLYHCFEDYSILDKELLVMHIKETKVTVAIELQLTEIFQNGVLDGIRVILLHAECILDAGIINVGYILSQIVLHAYLIEFLQSVLETIIIIIGSTLP